MTRNFTDVKSLAQIITQVSTTHWQATEFGSKVEQLESIKDKLVSSSSNESLHTNNEFTLSEWLATALMFQSECESVFNCPRNADLFNFLVPNITKQLSYIQDQIQNIANNANELTMGEIERFRQMFLIAALGFVTKLKLITFVTSFCSNS